MHETETTHTFDELSDKAKEHAIQKYNDTNDHEWWDGVYDDAKEQGKERGFEVDDIRFSGFSSQGDGASWTGRVRVKNYLDWKLSDMKPDDVRYGSWVILRELVENRLIIETIEISRGGGMYVHENTMRCDVDSGDYGSTDPDDYTGEADKVLCLAHGVMAGASIPALLNAFDFDEVIDTVIKDAFDDAKDYAHEIYKMLEKEFDWITSEEHFRETADANDWRFDDEGNLV